MKRMATSLPAEQILLQFMIAATIIIRWLESFTILENEWIKLWDLEPLGYMWRTRGENNGRLS